MNPMEPNLEYVEDIMKEYTSSNNTPTTNEEFINQSTGAENSDMFSTQEIPLEENYKDEEFVPDELEKNVEKSFEEEIERLQKIHDAIIGVLSTGEYRGHKTR